MPENSSINILIAEDNEISRQMMESVLEAHDYNIYGARDGTQAIEIINKTRIDLALVDINMAPMSGFDFMRSLIAHGIKTPVIVITGDDAANMLVEAHALGAAQVLSKPVTPDRLVQTVSRFLKKQGRRPEPVIVQSQKAILAPEELMQKVLEMAEKNQKSGKGGPFAALVVDSNGAIVGYGLHHPSSRADPVAHAEIMAIRVAAEKLERTDLSDCTLYCACAPTTAGEALVAAVGIKNVYFALSHDDVRGKRPAHKPIKPKYTQMNQEEARKLLKV